MKTTNDNRFNVNVFVYVDYCHYNNAWLAGRGSRTEGEPGATNSMLKGILFSYTLYFIKFS